MNLNKIKKFGKYLAGIVAAGAVLAVAMSPALGLRADAPRFNFLSGDEELFTGAKVDSASTTWNDPVTINAGDSFVARIYYHNGIVDSTAIDTKVKVNMPSVLEKGSTKLNASISADNAETVTDTVIDGVINGKSGLSFNLDQDVSLEYIAGSTKWYPDAIANQAQNKPLLYGQSGAELLSANGLGIGDIAGCWDHAGWVTFAVKTKKIVNTNIDIQKVVKNMSKLQTGYSESVNADQNDKLNFKFDVTASGNTALQGVTVNDVLPAELTAVAGSAKLIKNGVTTNISDSELLGNGVLVGSMQPNEVATILFDATAPAQILASKTVVNTAKVVSAQLHDQDTASVVLCPGNINVVKSKSAWNNTQNINAISAAAKPNDVIVYTLTTTNNGTLNTSVVVQDGIADVLEYADFVSASNSGSLVTGTAGTNDAWIVKYPESSINAGANLVRTFTVKVKSAIPTDAQNGYHFDLKMYNIYGNEVTICVEKPVIVITKPSLSVLKYVRNVTQNELTFSKADTAYAGDLLEYKIVFKNSGDGAADYVKISDLLPANVSFDANSAAILGMDGSEKSIAENMANGYVVATIDPGEEGYIRFKAITSSSIAAGEDLKNTAYLTDNGVVISDIAETIIKARIVQAKVEEKRLPRTGSAGSVGIALMAAMAVTGSLAFARERAK